MVPAPAPGRAARVFADPPVICGHRGIGRGVVRGHRENTIGSFRAAAAARVPWVEIDARLTADDVLVAHHDPVLPDGRPVVETTAREAEELGLMRVADLFTALPRRVGVDVEIKTALEDALRPRGQTTAALVARLLAGEQGRRRLLASSFDPAALVVFREVEPRVPIGLLTWKGYPLRKAIPAAVHLGAEVVAPHYTTLIGAGGAAASKEIGVAHAAGLEVVAWCPPPAEAAILRAAGVDCLIVDRPAPGSRLGRLVSMTRPGGR